MITLSKKKAWRAATTACILPFLLSLLLVNDSLATDISTRELFEAISQDDVNRLEDLINKGASMNVRGPGGQTPLMFGTLKGKPKTVKYLLDQGADATIGEKDGYTPVHGASFQGRSEVMKILIEHGLDPNHKHEDGFAPIHRVCWGREQRHDETLRVLLEAGVDPEEKAGNGMTPIEMANRPSQREMLLAFTKSKGKERSEL
mmetsp:Transcript_3340/g.3969  ORF Transcript_3340/g.3969 Transcript_3340/m.3969 type:complete len:203 (-) Transcript_3340:189-797(-)